MGLSGYVSVPFPNLRARWKSIPPVVRHFHVVKERFKLFGNLVFLFFISLIQWITILFLMLRHRKSRIASCIGSVSWTSLVVKSIRVFPSKRTLNRNAFILYFSRVVFSCFLPYLSHQQACISRNGGFQTERLSYPLLNYS